MREETKKIKRHVYKHLPTYGFIGAVCLIGGSIVYFNHLWTVLGENPKTQLLPQVTKDYEEFKDHATLIIALIAATGSILSSLLIMLFYGAWKEQYNKTEDSKLAKELYLVLQEEKEILFQLKVKFSSLPVNSIIYTTLDLSVNEIKDFMISKIINKMLYIKSSLIVFGDLSGDEEFTSISLEHSKSIANISDYWVEKFKIPTKIDHNIVIKNNKLCDNHIENIEKIQKELKGYIKVQ